MQNKAPERIYASPGNKTCVICFTKQSEEYSVEYIRADLCRAPEPVAVTEAMVDRAWALFLEQPRRNKDNMRQWLEAALT